MAYSTLVAARESLLQDRIRPMWFTASWSSSSRWRIGKKLPTALTVSWTSCSLRSTSSFFRLHMHLQFQKTPDSVLDLLLTALHFTHHLPAHATTVSTADPRKLLLAAIAQ